MPYPSWQLLSLKSAPEKRLPPQEEAWSDEHALIDKHLVFDGTTDGSMTVTAVGTLHLHGTCGGTSSPFERGLISIQLVRL